jgi:outer membrane protein OmpA-like peptidoglycan-associated protein
MPRTIALLLLLLVAAALAGCAGVTPAPSPPPPTTPAQRTAAAEQLQVERQWLGQWFRDTPVKIAQRGDGAVSVEVPREFSFDAGKTSVKPALAAVLDKVAESLRRAPQAQVALLAAPDDGAVTTPLATQRAERVREHLRAKGVADARLGRPSPAAAGTVHLRLVAAPLPQPAQAPH